MEMLINVNSVLIRWESMVYMRISNLGKPINITISRYSTSKRKICRFTSQS